MFLFAVHDKLLPTGLAELHTNFSAPIRAAARTYQQAIDELSRATVLTA